MYDHKNIHLCCTCLSICVLVLRRKYLCPLFLCSCLLWFVTVAMEDLLKLKHSRGGVCAAVTRNVNRAKDIFEAYDASV